MCPRVTHIFDLDSVWVIKKLVMTKKNTLKKNLKFLKTNVSAVHKAMNSKQNVA